MEKPGKRRRNISPLASGLSRSKRPTLLHHTQSTSPQMIKDGAAFPEFQPHFPTTTINAAIENINERATRLGLGNGYPQDVEMDTCSQSDEEKEEDADISNSYGETTYEKVPTQGSHAAPILPLHKPHPIAYQQHLALIASNRSKKTSSWNHQFGCSKKCHGGHKTKKLNPVLSP